MKPRASGPSVELSTLRAQARRYARKIRQFTERRAKIVAVINLMVIEAELKRPGSSYEVPEPKPEAPLSKHEETLWSEQEITALIADLKKRGYAPRATNGTL